MPTRSPLPLIAALALLLPATACRRDATAPPDQPPATKFAPGLMEVTISSIGSERMVARANAPAMAASTAVGTNLSLSGPASGSGSGDGTIELEPLSTGSFTVGARGAGGVRYLWATFRVRNAQSDQAPYDTPRRNLTFFATAATGTLGGSAITSMQRLDGSAADPSIATQVLPTGGVSQVNGLLVPNQADVLQVMTDREAAAVAAPAGVEVLPYGFVVRNAADGGRTLPASPAAGQYDGVVTFSFKVPLQATAAADPFTISALFLAADDDETRVTQSLEEQTPAGEAAFVARAQAIGATKTVLPGSGYRGDASETRTVCTVRTAGPSASPAAYLVDRSVVSVTLADPFPGWPLSAGGAVARALTATALDAGGAPLADVPLQMSFGAADVLAAAGGPLVRKVPRRDGASTTVTASACGLTSAPLTLRTSGVRALGGKYFHALALTSDDTVAAWGLDDDGQATPPTGLTGIVQVAGGLHHSLALGSDGSVTGWGLDDHGQATPPSSLADVVQIAAGALFSLALKRDGTVVGWGDNSSGQLNVPTGLAGVMQIDAGDEYALALETDGTVVAWGNNSSGQATVPAGLAHIVQVAAGWRHSLALRSDGTVVAWGDDSFGETSVPAGLTDVVQIAAGVYHSLALKSDGTVVAWGGDAGGQSTVPAGLTNVVQIAAGQYHSLALKSDGTVVVWGDNTYGQATVPAGLVATVP
ncbi:MAG TPA: hypothetical protein VF041_07120 [Gemmatimonadaceae bacterium]